MSLSPPSLAIGQPSPSPRPGAVAAGQPATIGVTVVPGHPSNVVDLSYRVDGGPVRVAHARPAGIVSLLETQSFVAQLPALADGQRLDFRAELRRAGRLAASAPADGSWQTVTAAPEQVVRSGPLSSARFPAWDLSGVPRFGYGLEFLGALTVQLRAEVMGHTPQGYRINFFVVHGEAHGPRLHGKVRPEGGDWMNIREDGVGEVDIKITYETPDGALILEQSGGVFDIGPDGYRNVIRGIYRGAPPFFATPTYITADSRWKWINSLQCFGFGRVVMPHLRVECDIYAPHLQTEPHIA